MVHLYGIPNCDTVKKSLDWLKSNKVDFTFHDFKKEALPVSKLKTWNKALGINVLLNKKSTTWRALTAEEQEAAATEKGAIALMQQKPSVMKRPIVEWANGKITAGFDEMVFSANM